MFREKKIMPEKYSTRGEKTTIIINIISGANSRGKQKMKAWVKKHLTPEVYVKVDLTMMVVILLTSLIAVLAKQHDPNAWTGLYVLGLLPIVVLDFRKDYKKWLESLSKEKTT